MMVDFNEIIIIQGVTYKYCQRCEDLLQTNKFNVNPKNPTGYYMRCADCERKKKRIYYEESKGTFFTYEEILTGMGYDLNKDIHEQFCLKHGLTPKTKKD